MQLSKPKLIYTVGISCFLFNMGLQVGVIPTLLAKSPPKVVSVFFLLGIFSLFGLTNLYPKLTTLKRLALFHIVLSILFFLSFYVFGFYLSYPIGYAFGVIYIGKIFEIVGRLEPYVFNPEELKVADKIKTALLIVGTIVSIFFGKNISLILKVGSLVELLGLFFIIVSFILSQKE